MKIYFPIFPILLFLAVSCGSKTAETKEEVSASDSTALSFTDFDFNQLKGLYKGDFGDSPISLNLTFTSENHATGFNIVSGNKRNVSGLISIKGKEITLKLNEPGDDKNDGVFTLYMDTNNLAAIRGQWESQSGEVKTVSLKKAITDSDDNEDNFANYDQVFTDSIGDLSIQSDGSCYYEYVENAGLPSEQTRQVKGSWKKVNDIVTIFWQPNAVFKNRKSIFNIERGKPEEGDSEYTYYPATLSGEGRQLTQLMY